MDLGLKDKVALVAGGSSGLGLAFAKELAAAGAGVSIASRSAERLADAAREIGGDVHTATVDVRDQAAVRAWVDAAAECFGAVHIVFANAGGPTPGPATAFDVADYREAIEVNLLGSIALVQTALPHLKAAGWGRVLFVTSQGVRRPIPHLALSNTARPGILGYAQSLVHDLADSGITVNVLAPGLHRTARLEQLAGDDEQALAAMAQSVPLGRIGAPEEFAAVAAFLASERASYVTGAVVPVDGGSTGLLL
ncbi:MAG TPA: SDR family oxidoreductase [Egibacteraceae bacterium]|nr:SDR family oxidoreductase [Egibacteraceae bacterium]